MQSLLKLVNQVHDQLKDSRLFISSADVNLKNLLFKNVLKDDWLVSCKEIKQQIMNHARADFKAEKKNDFNEENKNLKLK